MSNPKDDSAPDQNPPGISGAKSVGRSTRSDYLDIAEVLLLVIGRDEKIELINRKGCEILGYSEKEITGQNWFDRVVPAECRNQVRRVFRKLIEGEEQRGYYENEVLTKSGQRRLIAWHNKVLLDENGRITGTISSGEDITERKWSETRLVASERRMQAILDNCVEGVITIDWKGKIDSFNKSAEKIFGYSADEVLGRNISLLMPEPDRSRHHEYLDNYLHTGRAKIIGIGREVEGLRKDGTIFPLHLGVADVSYDNQRVFVGTVRDLTPYKQLQDELERNRIFAALGEMSATVAHEIKNPLAAISGVIEVLLDGTPESDPKHEVLAELIARVGQMDQTVRRLLRFAKPSIPEKQEFNLREIIDGVVEHASQQERFQDIEFLIEGGKDIPVSLDLVLFEDVLWNVLYNSVNAMPDGGQVRIDLSTTPRHQIVSIADTGAGISPEDIDKIFRPLFTTTQHGTGIGLALCRRIMQAHDGSIEISSQQSFGTEVVLKLPR